MNLGDLRKITWEGYLRADGTKGIRNKVIVVYTVECSSFVAHRIVAEINNPDVEVIGFDGCTDNAYAIHLLTSLITHPNVGAVLAVGLGCEYTQADRLAKVAKEHGRTAQYFYIQESGGTAESIKKGVKIVAQMLDELKNTPRVTMGFKDLTVGAECGGSDFTKRTCRKCCSRKVL